MRKKSKKSSVNESGWRKLAPKHRSAQTHSRPAKKLGIAGRIFLLLVVLGISGLGFWSLDRWVGTHTGPFDITGPGMPISNVEFVSDGALSTPWFSNWFGPLRERTLMDIDIDRLRLELRTGIPGRVSKDYPMFPIHSASRSKGAYPLLVLRLRNRQGSHEDWIVVSQGTLYQAPVFQSPVVSSPITLRSLQCIETLSRWRRI